MVSIGIRYPERREIIHGKATALRPRKICSACKGCRTSRKSRAISNNVFPEIFENTSEMLRSILTATKLNLSTTDHKVL